MRGGSGWHGESQRHRLSGMGISTKPIIFQSCGKGNRGIEDVIREVTEEFTEKGSCTVWDINNGQCEDWAMAVIDRMGGHNEYLTEFDSMNFFNINDYSYSGDTKYGAIPSDLIKSKYDPPNHVWIYYDGKHYDAEELSGVKNYFDLPIFKKETERQRKQLGLIN